MLIKKIAIKDIKLRDYNRDQITDASVRELADSINESGLLQPILVSTAPAGSKHAFDLVAGERRVRACKLIGAVEIDAHVTTMDQITQERCNLTENLQRQDLTVWEESKHVVKLKDLQPEARVEDLAAQLGRSSPWVAQRLAMSKLLPSLRDLVEKQEWPIGHIVLVARLRLEVQVSLLEYIKQQQKGGYGSFNQWDQNIGKFAPCAPSLRSLRELLEKSERTLSGARWKLDDDTLVPAAGACNECPKRSSQEGHLFQEPGDNPKHDKCLDAKCWKLKEAALVQLSITKLKLKGEEPICLGSDREDKPEGIDKVYDRYDYQLVKKSTPGAKPAIVVNGERAGEVCFVKPMSSSAGTMKSHRTLNQETGKKQGPSTKERLETLKLKRQGEAVKLWSQELETIELQMLTSIRLAAIFGTEHRHTHVYDSKEIWKEYKKTPKIAAEVAAQLAVLVVPVMQQRLSNPGTIKDVGPYWKEAQEQAEAMDATKSLDNCYAKAVEMVPMSKALVKDGVQDPDQAPAPKPTGKKG